MCALHTMAAGRSCAFAAAAICPASRRACCRGRAIRWFLHKVKPVSKAGHDRVATRLRRPNSTRLTARKRQSSRANGARLFVLLGVFDGAVLRLNILSEAKDLSVASSLTGHTQGG